MATLRERTVEAYKVRNEKINRAWASGTMSHASIAKQHGISRQAVQMICSMAKLREAAK